MTSTNPWRKREISPAGAKMPQPSPPPAAVLPSRPQPRPWSMPAPMRLPVLAAALLLPILIASCAGNGAPAPKPPPETLAAATIRHERAYLLNPLDGYAQTVDPVRRERITRANEALVAIGSVVEARQAAADMLAVAPSFAPAKVLAAQVDFVEGNPRAVVERLLAVGDGQPNYTASQLLLGRAADVLGDVPLAYAAFRAVAARSGKAFERAGELHAKALQIVGERLRAALASTHDDRLAEADRQLALLRAWAPGEPATLEGARALAVARRDLKAELEAVKGLEARRPDDRELLDRRAELELEVGDPGAGLKIVQELAERNPGDTALAEKVRIGKFRWSLSLLPADVRQMAEKPELTRADLSVLLYWLVPQVRYGRANSGRIATDVLDDPHREEIVHVVNLGLLDVDANLHRFSPTAPARRGAALRSVNRLLAGFGHQVACVEKAGGSAASPCDMGLACGLIAEDEECDANSAVSGPDAVEWIRRSLVLLGGT
jgi:hypothetical protein